MIRTGPARRHRIGDVVAGTTVIATDGLSARKGTPGWMLPAATLLALLASVAFAYAIAEAGNQPLTDAQRAQFITQCQSTAGQLIDCGCVLTQLEAAGYDTPNDLDNLIAEGEAQVSAGTIGSARAELMSAVGACRP